MTLHLKSIRPADHARSDVRCLSRLREEKAEQLRGEVEQVTPLLRWPIRINVTNTPETGQHRLARQAAPIGNGAMPGAPVAVGPQDAGPFHHNQNLKEVSSQ